MTTIIFARSRSIFLRILDLVSTSTNFLSKRPIAIVKCKIHNTTEARGKCKIGCVLQPVAGKEGLVRRKASPRGIPTRAFYIRSLNMKPT